MPINNSHIPFITTRITHFEGEIINILQNDNNEIINVIFKCKNGHENKLETDHLFKRICLVSPQPLCDICDDIESDVCKNPLSKKELEIYNCSSMLNNDVKNILEKYNCHLISTILNEQNEVCALEFVCNCDKIKEKILFTDIYKRIKYFKSICLLCSKYRNRFKSYFEVYDLFSKNDSQLLTTIDYFKNKNMRFDYLCNLCNGINKIHLKYISKPNGCPCPCKKRLITFINIKKKFEKRNCLLLTKFEEYTNNRMHLKYKCNICENIKIVIVANFLKYDGCCQKIIKFN